MAIIWIIASIVVALIANSKGRSFIGWLVLAIVFTPILMGILVLAYGKKEEKENGVPVHSNVDYGRYEGVNRLSNPHYRDYLTRRYVITKNEVLGTFTFNNKSFADLDSLLLAVAEKDGGRP